MDKWYDKVVFINMNAVLGTDEQFTEKSDEDHHLEGASSPIEHHSIGMVSHFPLDPMHLSYVEMDVAELDKRTFDCQSVFQSCFSNTWPHAALKSVHTVRV